MAEKIVLIDGHSILNRAFYGVPDLTNAEGLHTNAIYGFLNILFKILDEEKPEYLTVAFDVHAPTFRHEMYQEYKGTRKPMAEELRQQVPVMKDVLSAMGICVIEQAGLEADDLLGTISKKCEGEGLEVSVISGDRDLLQLASEHIKIRIPKTKQGKTEIENYYSDDVLARYQVSPTEFIDLKALMGDTADNIPGVPSIGEKTATKIITEYHSIENAYAHVDELKPPRASKALKEHWDLAVLSKELATICVDATFDYHLENARLENIFTEEAYQLFMKLQFKNLLGKFEVGLPANQIEKGFITITNFEQAKAVLNEAKGQKQVGVAVFKNTENVLPLFAMDSEFGGIGICFSNKNSYCIPVGNGITKEFLCKEVESIISNVKETGLFDLKKKLDYFKSCEETHVLDLVIAAYLLNPLKNDYSFEDIAQEQLNLIIDQKNELHMNVCYEAYTAWAAIETLKKKLQETDMWELYTTVEMPLVYTLYDMEQAGVKIEADALKEYGDALKVQIQTLEKEIYEEAGEEFNINSPKQLGVVLFENMGLKGGRKTKTGYSTAADVLEKLAKDYPVIAKILEYRQLTKLKSTYADGLINYVKEDGRIHGTFNQTITATGRISSTDPNLQNIPIRMELGRKIRKVFVPENEYVFVDADYSQIELRVLAHCSNDMQLIEAYKEEKDIHRITASQVFHTPFEEVTELQRRNAKAVNFGIVYGISSYGLSEDLSIDIKEAKQYIERYFETYPGIKQFLDQAIEEGKQNGYVKTIFGRRRPVPELKSSNFMQRSFGERVAMNAPIQGAAADIMKIAMNRVNCALKKNNMKSRLVLQVHDELLIEAHKDEVDLVKMILKTEMEGAASLAVPLVVDMHDGKNWFEAK